MKLRILCTLALLLTAVTASAQYRPIHNDTFWNTADGKPLYSQGGGIFRFADPATGHEQYYWYGIRYQESRSPFPRQGTGKRPLPR